jgi:hypothetical protein
MDFSAILAPFQRFFGAFPAILAYFERSPIGRILGFSGTFSANRAVRVKIEAL